MSWALVCTMSDFATCPTLTCVRLSFALALALSLARLVALAIALDEAFTSSWSFAALAFAFASRCAAVLRIESSTAAIVTRGTFSNHANLLFGLLSFALMRPLRKLALAPLLIAPLLVLCWG